MKAEGREGKAYSSRLILEFSGKWEWASSQINKASTNGESEWLLDSVDLGKLCCCVFKASQSWKCLKSNFQQPGLVWKEVIKFSINKPTLQSKVSRKVQNQFSANYAFLLLHVPQLMFSIIMPIVPGQDKPACSSLFLSSCPKQACRQPPATQEELSGPYLGNAQGGVPAQNANIRISVKRCSPRSSSFEEGEVRANKSYCM